MIVDVSAETGVCAWMPGWTREWGVQADIDDRMLSAEAKFDAAATIKVVKKGGGGSAFTAGIYDGRNRRMVGNIEILGKDLEDGVWKTFTLGQFTPAPGLYLWVAPAANAACVQEVRVSHFTLRQRR